MSDLRSKRSGRLVQAACTVFVADGFRGTTMERIAEAASVSKATLYSYFPDKPAIFDAVAQSVARDLVAVVEAALAKAQRPEDAVIEALVAKHEVVRSLVRKSEHAKELFSTKDAVSAHHFRQSNAIIRDRLAQRLSTVLDDNQDCAEFLLAASQGIANAAKSKDQLRQQISKLRHLIKQGL